MDPKIASRFNDNILTVARQRYDIPADKIQLLDGFESFIYEFSRPDGDYILRIGHSGRRTPDLIRGEVDWINTLADGDASVARAILSLDGNLVEPIEDGHGDEFLCTAFIKARGVIAERKQINERLFLNYGRLMGRMHALAKTYTPSNPAWKRPEWNDPINMYADMWLPGKYDHLLPKYRQLVAHLESLPCDPEGYGMIHQDAHPGNFFLTEDYTLTLFDFDDCVYGHFIHDIAMVLFYASMWEEDDPVGFTGRFMPIFLQGYREENRLDPDWLKEFPHFLKLREIDLFAIILFTMGETPEDAWCAWYMQGRRERIEGDVPFIEFEWESLKEYL